MRAPEHAVKIKKRAAKSCGNPAEGMTAQWFKSQKTRAVKTLQIVTSTWKNRYENPYQQRVYAFSPRAGKYSKNRPSVQDAEGVPSWIGGRASKAGRYVDPLGQWLTPRTPHPASGRPLPQGERCGIGQWALIRDTGFLKQSLGGPPPTNPPAIAYRLPGAYKKWPTAEHAEGRVDASLEEPVPEAVA
jgi:hypothetical protein